MNTYRKILSFELGIVGSISHCDDGWVGWVRFGNSHGPGFSLKNTEPFFSERAGYDNPIFKFKGWRLMRVKRLEP